MSEDIGFEFTDMQVDKVEDRPIISPEKKSEQGRPGYTEPGWPEWVMSHFEADELVDGKPKADGLRRVTELILGPVLSSITEVVQAPCPQNGNRAVCRHTIKILWTLPEDGMGAAYKRTFADVADVYPGNCDPAFAVFPTAVAGTRAEARAFRKALRLKGVVAAEECFKVPLEKTEFINETQAGLIDVLCQRLNISLGKLINAGSQRYDTLREVSFGKAVEIINHLQSYQRGFKQVPPRLVGYDPDWQKTF